LLELEIGNVDSFVAASFKTSCHVSVLRPILLAFARIASEACRDLSRFPGLITPRTTWWHINQESSCLKLSEPAASQFRK
jgi:hypothetical protein